MPFPSGIAAHAKRHGFTDPAAVSVPDDNSSGESSSSSSEEAASEATEREEAPTFARDAFGPALIWVITSLPPAGPDAITSKAVFVVAVPSGRDRIAIDVTTFPDLRVRS